MRDADRRLLLRVRTQVARFLDTMAKVLADTSVAGMLDVCSTAVQSGAIPDEDLAGALHLALVPYRGAVAGKDDAEQQRFIDALVEIAIAPLERHLRLDGAVVRSFCTDPANRENLLRWASKLLRATEAAHESAQTETK